jgi:plasmid maintenance system antidote protein VapI
LDQWNKVSGPLEISQSAFAIRLGLSFPRLNEIVRGKRGVTPDTALRLELIRKASWKKRRSTGSEG